MRKEVWNCDICGKPLDDTNSKHGWHKSDGKPHRYHTLMGIYNFCTVSRKSWMGLQSALGTSFMDNCKECAEAVEKVIKERKQS